MCAGTAYAFYKQKRRLRSLYFDVAARQRQLTLGLLTFSVKTFDTQQCYRLVNNESRWLTTNHDERAHMSFLVRGCGDFKKVKKPLASSAVNVSRLTKSTGSLLRLFAKSIQHSDRGQRRGEIKLHDYHIQSGSREQGISRISISCLL